MNLEFGQWSDATEKRLLFWIGAAVIPLLTVATTVSWPWIGLALGLLFGFLLAAVRAVIADDEKDRAVAEATEAARKAGDERGDSAPRGNDSQWTSTKLELEAAREEIRNLKLDVKMLEERLLKSNGG